MQQITARNRRHWQGGPREGSTSYNARIPIVVTTLDRLHEGGLTGQDFWLRAVINADAEAQPRLLTVAAALRQERSYAAREPGCSWRVALHI